MRTLVPVKPALVAIGLAMLVRFATLGVQSVWLDEAFSILSAQTHSAAEIWSPGIDPIHPPLYYLILRASLGCLGVAEFGARAPSAIASTINIVLVGWLAHVLFPQRRLGVFAALLVALAPIDLWYAQEARMYALVTTAGLLWAIGLTLDAVWAPALAASALLFGLYLDHTMWPLAILIAVSALAWPVERRQSLSVEQRLFVALVAVMFGAQRVWAQAGVAYGQLDKISLVKNVAQRIGGGSVTRWPLPVVMLGFVVVAVVASRLISRWVRRTEETAPWQRLVAVAFAVATVAIVVPRAYSLKQVLVCVWPYVVIVAAWAADDARAGWRARALVAVSACACLMTFVTPRADWRGVVTTLTARARPATRVVLDPPYNGQPWAFYRTAASPATIQTDGTATDVLQRLSAGGEELCLVAERFGAVPPTSPTERWLDGHLTLASMTHFARLDVRCYGPRR